MKAPGVPPRVQTARSRVVEALRSEHAARVLSDVIYDAAEDGIEGPDGEGGTWTPDHGFDCDDLAAALVALLADSGAMKNAKKETQ